MKHFAIFDLPWSKRIGFFVLGIFVGMAIANGYSTSSALDGQARYYRQHEKQHVEVQKKLDEKKIDAAVANALGQPSQ